ncbi:HFL030Cp [Eremothecium sinecaudum]|uniref:HFL030Cp n=1 Tax=Eremothecium sinecaudum TaxID=45286 RepID=A0A109UZU3_9SACH|nr:HFL030Cp [Eremothecium sinecaudum]AMD21826.1 HFL030Cp [Eremothecium sinecaudum]
MLNENLPSQVIEYQCQYTDQLLKKRKTWHDGKLKFFRLTNKFQLFDEEGVMLSSDFVTNSKKIANICDEEGFGVVEHHIFSSYLVIIEQVQCEYTKEINLHQDKNTNVSRRQVLKSTHTKQKATDITRHSLSLQLNKPFKPPKLKNVISIISTSAPYSQPELPSTSTMVTSDNSSSMAHSQPCYRRVSLDNRVRSIKRTIIHEPIVL